MTTKASTNWHCWSLVLMLFRHTLSEHAENHGNHYKLIDRLMALITACLFSAAIWVFRRLLLSSIQLKSRVSITLREKRFASFFMDVLKATQCVFFLLLWLKHRLNAILCMYVHGKDFVQKSIIFWSVQIEINHLK